MNTTPVIVTTEHRGVFFGYMGEELPTKEKITIKQARNCLYWDVSVKGFIGLATTGPNEKCRIGPAAPSLTLFDVTAVVECTQQAADMWEAAPWA